MIHIIFVTTFIILTVAQSFGAGSAGQPGPTRRPDEPSFFESASPPEGHQIMHLSDYMTHRGVLKGGSVIGGNPPEAAPSTTVVVREVPDVCDMHSLKKRPLTGVTTVVLDIKDYSPDGWHRNYYFGIQEFLNSLSKIFPSMTKIVCRDFSLLKEHTLDVPPYDITSLDLSSVLSWNSEGSDNFLQTLAMYEQLTVLHLASNSLGDQSEEYLIRLNGILCMKPFLSHLDLRYNSYKNFGADGEEKGNFLMIVLKGLPLRSLDLAHNHVGDSDRFYLFLNPVSHMKNLTVLSLKNMRINPDNAHHIGSLLGYLRELERLDLSDNHLKEGIIPVCKGLEGLKRLRELRLRINKIGSAPGTMGAVAKALTGMLNLKTLDLAGNCCGTAEYDNEWRQLYKALATHPTLEELSLMVNRPLAEGDKLEGADFSGSQLRSLNLNHIGMNDSTVQNLLGALLETKIDTLTLYANNIVLDPRTRALLVEMRHLKNVDLSRNPIDESRRTEIRSDLNVRWQY